ncbi:hypothetical protein N7462_001729 [Penicillium macrosclerotiorum]|uniref:uncharacterized protein n=1 Tax=Penicillium macrosclerotiorum TaxID=303699 RepID=UPI0025478CDC|nr:uncharacterized protein N7462_001729 [Penicillium macrosclerotiorum]KAJ5692306.1 hypothetical protein N7462_001729 [Penicillium macrosclerotiorum]
MAHLTHHAPASLVSQGLDLDSEIISIRAEISNLQRRKRVLASSLLAAAPIQKLTRKPPPALTSIHDDVSPLVRAAGNHAQSNHYRIAFGATAFPFTDPSPQTPDTLLGVRIDVCVRSGRFAKPYYILLKRDGQPGDKQRRLRVHKHTIPAFIAVDRLESVYLRVPGLRKRTQDEMDTDSDIEDGSSVTSKKRQAGSLRQDLRGFVRELRRDLVAWHLRCDAVELLREKLGLSEEESQLDESERLSPESRGGVVSVAETAVEARYVRLEWEDGRVGRFKLTNAGIVERAVVIGDNGRDKKTEDAMTGSGGRVETLLERLKDCGPGLGL